MFRRRENPSSLPAQQPQIIQVDPNSGFSSFPEPGDSKKHLLPIYNDPEDDKSAAPAAAASSSSSSSSSSFNSQLPHPSQAQLDQQENLSSHNPHPTPNPNHNPNPNPNHDSLQHQLKEQLKEFWMPDKLCKVCYGCEGVFFYLFTEGFPNH